jgi:hypothetical protein
MDAEIERDKLQEFEDRIGDPVASAAGRIGRAPQISGRHIDGAGCALVAAVLKGNAVLLAAIGARERAGPHAVAGMAAVLRRRTEGAGFAQSETYRVGLHGFEGGAGEHENRGGGRDRDKDPS